jgi:hypothetical protein
MSNSFLWNEATGQREPIADRDAFMAALYRKVAEEEAAGQGVETAALSADTALPDILAPEAAPMPDVAGPVPEPTKFPDMAQLYRDIAEDKAARLAAETAVLSADTAPPEILVPEAAPMPDVAGPVGEPAKTAKPTQKPQAKE